MPEENQDPGAAAGQPEGEARAMSLAEQADKIAALEQQLGEATGANETLTKEVEDLKAKLEAEIAAGAEEHAKGADVYSSLLQAQEYCSKLQGEAVELNATITTLTADLTAARAEFVSGTLERTEHDEDKLCNLWVAAGGKLGDFQAARRFAASL